MKMLSFCSCVLAVFLSTSALYADEAQTLAKTDEIMATIMSPYCPGRLLKDCPSGQALQLKEDIISRIEKGEDSNAIVESLVVRFGDSIRAAPKASGFGLVAWVAPILFLLLGGIMIVAWLRSRLQHGETSTVVLDSESEARVEAELRR